MNSQKAVVSSQDWQTEFTIPAEKLSDQGESRFFILTPGFEKILESKNARLIIRVLDETRLINGFTTRVVEEREEINGSLYELSRNLYAIDSDSGDVYYFGEEVDIFQNGVIFSHKGAWLAYENQHRPGLIMPGNPLVGMKYYQEFAPGVAMDRAEVIDVSVNFNSPAGEFSDCLITKETSAIEPVSEQKTYCPGIGLVQDQALYLTGYGYQGN